MMYRHLNTGLTAEVTETLENSVMLRIVETGELKEVKTATFKRWWRAVEEAPEAQDTPEEAQTSTDEPEVPKPEEIPAEEPKPQKRPQGSEDKPLALSDVVSKLESLYDVLNRLYFEDKLPKPIITVQSSPKAYGHCSTKKIWKKTQDGENEGQYEINIGAEFLNRPNEQTASTMLHEMIHLYCRENDIEETCQNGRYHNKRFLAECEARDLVVEYDRANGYSTTKPSDALTKGLKANGYELNVPFARHTIEKERKTPLRTKAHKYVCPVCGQKVSTTQELSLICGHCKVEMERAD